MLRSWKPHVLVSDIEMPGEDGYSLIRKVRELGGSDGGQTPGSCADRLRTSRGSSVFALGRLQHARGEAGGSGGAPA